MKIAASASKSGIAAATSVTPSASGSCSNINILRTISLVRLSLESLVLIAAVVVLTMYAIILAQSGWNFQGLMVIAIGQLAWILVLIMIARTVCGFVGILKRNPGHLIAHISLTLGIVVVYAVAVIVVMIASQMTEMIVQTVIASFLMIELSTVIISDKLLTHVRDAEMMDASNHMALA